MRQATVTALLATVSLAADWKKDAVFRATFDGTTDATIGAGDRRLYSAAGGYKAQANARPGLEGAPVEHVRDAGRNGGGALRFVKQNRAAVFYQAEGNIPVDARNWSGTISLWLKVDPETELAPGFCDPIQVTDKAYNDSAIWVDFTKDDKPRHFRLGVFGALSAWNPQRLESGKNPAFDNRLVVVRKTPFARDRWTHVAITFERLGSGNGVAKLYLDGKLQGATPVIGELFEWDAAKGAIRLGVSYVGLMDDVAVFRRPLEEREIRALSRW